MQNYKKYQYVVLLTPYFFILKKFKRKIHATLLRMAFAVLVFVFTVFVLSSHERYRFVFYFTARKII